MGSPGVVEGKQTMKILLTGAFLAVALAAPEAAPEAAASPEANADPWYGYYGYGGYRGYYGYARPYGYYGYYGKRSAEAEPTAEAAASPEAEADPWYGYYGYRPYGYGYYGYRPYGYGYYYGKRSAAAEANALLGPMLIRGMDTTDTEDTEVIMAMPDLMDTTVTMERGLLRLCLLLRPRLPPRLRLIPGMDTMDTDTGLMATDTMDTGLMVMDTGERSKKPEYCQLILNIVLFLPTLKHLNTSVYKTFSFENFKNILFCLIGCRDLFQQSNKVSKLIL